MMDMKAGVAGLRRRRAPPWPATGRPGAARSSSPRSPTTWASSRARSASSRSTRPTTASSRELTDLQIYLGHRGRLYWDITSIGHSAHTCHRHLAVNAIAKMVPLIEEVEALRYEPELPDWVAELFGPELYTAVGRIYGGLPPGGPSMIPDECTIRVDSRPQPGIDESRGRGG